jgi:hypothetical protein
LGCINDKNQQRLSAHVHVNQVVLIAFISIARCGSGGAVLGADFLTVAGEEAALLGAALSCKAGSVFAETFKAP